MSFRDTGPYVHIYLDRIPQFGAGGSAYMDAAVFDWIAFRCRASSRDSTYEHDGQTWYRASLDVLGGELHLGRDVVKRSLDRLSEAGLVQCVQHMLNGPYDRTKSYRPIYDTDVDRSRHDDVADSPNVPILPKEEEKTNTRSASDQSLQGFDQFWNAYPRKEGKAGAKPHYQKIIKSGTTPDQLTQAAQAYAAKVKTDGTDKKYVRKAYNWLRDGDWEDLIPEAAGDVIDQCLADGDMQRLQELTNEVFEADFVKLQDLRGEGRKSALLTQWRLWVDRNRDRLEVKLSTP